MLVFFFFNDTATTEIYTLSLHDALPISSADVYYASGFSNSNPTIPGDHLQPHTTFDLSLGKEFAERLSVSLSGINVANRRVVLDNNFTFCGTPYLNPPEGFFPVRYCFYFLQLEMRRTRNCCPTPP